MQTCHGTHRVISRDSILVSTVIGHLKITMRYYSRVSNSFAFSNTIWNRVNGIITDHFIVFLYGRCCFYAGLVSRLLCWILYSPCRFYLSSRPSDDNVVVSLKMIRWCEKVKWTNHFSEIQNCTVQFGASIGKCYNWTIVKFGISFPHSTQFAIGFGVKIEPIGEMKIL